jgi:acetyl esterase/lipase
MKPDPQTVAFNAQIEAMLNAGPAWEGMGAQELRDHLRDNPLGPPPVLLDEAQTRTAPGPDGDVPLRVLVPEVVNGVYLHIHGGGWVIGTNDGADEALMARAVATQQAVVSVGYRLAPEHRYPAPNDDCEAAAVWLAENAPAEFGTDKLTIGGESAGGHLAVTTMLRMRDKHDYRFRGAALQCGVYDLRLTPSARNFGDRRLIINTPVMEWFIDHYASELDLTQPDISPIYADLHDLAPAIFSVGTADPLLDDSLLLAAQWEAAGNETQLDVYPEASHVFDAFPIPAGAEATGRIDSWLSRSLAD